MKVRSGFVSNSSSSSFVCDICHEVQSGMDMCLSDAQMSRCVNGHTFCDEHRGSEIAPGIQLQLLINLLEDSKNSSYMQEIRTALSPKMDGLDKAKGASYCSDAIEAVYAEFQDWIEDEWPHDVPACMCPICTFQSVFPSDVYKYLLKRLGVSKVDILQELTEKFSDYKKFKEYVK